MELLQTFTFSRGWAKIASLHKVTQSVEAKAAISNSCYKRQQPLRFGNNSFRPWAISSDSLFTVLINRSEKNFSQCILSTKAIGVEPT
jgi:hypothetical protein